MSDIIDQIDALVDDQLSTGEPRTGYDYGDPQFPDCPHCERKWHGLPVTVRIAEMYAMGKFDEDYRLDTDDSAVLCRGSEFIGPMPAEERFGIPGWESLTAALTCLENYTTETARAVLGMSRTRITYRDSNGEFVTGTVTNVEASPDGGIDLTITPDNGAIFQFSGSGSFEFATQGEGA